MTTFRSEETLVGIVALGVVPWIGWTLLRGLRSGQLPIYRTYVSKTERPGAFAALIGFYVLAAIGMAVIALDLLFGLGIGG